MPSFLRDRSSVLRRPCHGMSIMELSMQSSSTVIRNIFILVELTLEEVVYMEDGLITIKRTISRLDLPSSLQIEMKEGVLNRREWVMYLAVPEWVSKVKDNKLISGKPSKEFYRFVVDQVNQYIFDNKEPEPEVATAIMNIADDYLAGRDQILRAGDYIAIQEYLRGQRSSKGT
jgi:hypothetical protein